MAIQMRRGNFADFDPTRMVAGEFAVCLDNGYVYMTLSPGNVIRLGTAETIEEALAQAQEYATQARTAASNAQTYATNADTSAETSESWAVGKKDGTDVPDTDPAYHNNAKYWSDQAYIIQGTVEDLLENFEDKIPTATVTRNAGDDYATVTITDQNGTTTAVINDGISPDLTATATVNSEVGTPAVEMTRTGTQDEPVFNFAFSNLKGDPGETGDTGRSVSSLVMSGTGKEHPITATYSDGTSEVVGTLRDGEDGTGSGDMTKATYDQNNNGLVDNAEALSNGTDRLTYADVASGIQGAGGASTLIEDTVGWLGKNTLDITLDKLKALNGSRGSWSGNVLTYRGIDYTIYTDANGYVTKINVNGTAESGNSDMVLLTADGKNKQLGEELTISGCPSGGSNATYLINCYRIATVDGSGGTVQDTGDGATFTFLNNGSGTVGNIAILIFNGITINKDFYPMLRKAEISEPDFVPHHDSVLEVLRDAEVIDCPNLAFKKIPTAQITSGGIIETLSGFDIYVAKVESGKTYSVKVDDTFEEYAFFTSEPFIGSVSYNNSRTLASGSTGEYTFTAPISGYVAIRSVANYDYAQVNEGSVLAEYSPYYIPLKDSKFDRAEQRVLGAKNFLNLDDDRLIACQYQKTDTGIRVYNSSAGQYQFYSVWLKNLPKNTDFTISCNVTITSGEKARLVLSDRTGGGTVLETWNITSSGKFSVTFNTANYDQLSLAIYCTTETSELGDITYNDFQIRLASDPDDTYAPYAMTNKELTDAVNNPDESNSTVAFTQAGSRTNINTGEKLSVMFGKIKKWFADLKTVAFTGSYNDLIDKPEQSGGNENIKGTVGWVSKDYLYFKASDIKALNTAFTWNGNVGIKDGVTVTLNVDGNNFVESVNIDGYTGESAQSFNLSNGALENDVEYFFKGCPTGGSNSTYYMSITRDPNEEADTGSGVYFTNTGTATNTQCKIQLAANKTFSNILFKPSLRKASDHFTVQDVMGMPNYYIEVKGDDLAGTYQTVNEPIVLPDGAITSNKPFKMVLKNVGTSKAWRTNTQALFVKERSTETVYKVKMGRINGSLYESATVDITLTYARSTTNYDLNGEYVELEYHPHYGTRNNYTQNNYFKILNANYYPTYDNSDFMEVVESATSITNTTPHLFNVSSDHGYILFTREYAASSPYTYRGHHAYYINVPYSDSAAPSGISMASSSNSGVTVNYYAAGASAGDPNNQTVSVKASSASYVVDATLYSLAI